MAGGVGDGGHETLHFVGELRPGIFLYQVGITQNVPQTGAQIVRHGVGEVFHLRTLGGKFSFQLRDALLRGFLHGLRS